MASETTNNSLSNFDKLPIALQMLIGIAALLLIAAVGFGVFFAVDLLLLDFDPIGKLVSLIASK